MGVVPDSLALNGGAITSEATGAEADLRHDGTIIIGTRDDGGGGPEGNGPTAQFSDLVWCEKAAEARSVLVESPK